MILQVSPILLFCLTSVTQRVIALQCYNYETLECQWFNNLYETACNDLPRINKPPSAATVQQCPETDDRCFMVIATGENDNVGVCSISGECASSVDLWQATDCRDAMSYQDHDVLGWHVTRGQSFGTDLKTAKVCVCDTDLCNGQNSQRIVTRLSVCLTLLITVWFNM